MAYDKLVIFFNQLAVDAHIKDVKWHIEHESIATTIDHHILKSNIPKTYKGIVLAIGTKLYERFGINHPLICADRERGKQYEIIKTKEGTFKITIPIKLLRELSRDITSKKNAARTESLTDEEINNAIEYLNGQKRASYGIQDLNDDSHVLTITPIKNDPGNYQLKIKSHMVRLGRTHTIEENITTVIMPAKQLKEYADKNLREKKKK
jgi:hypothetical protein